MSNYAYRISDEWTEVCRKKSLVLSATVTNEFKKRQAAAMHGHAKSKLNLNSSKLTDDHIILLTQVLMSADTPIISKIELLNNKISNRGGEAIYQLLNHQLYILKTISIDTRLRYAFLSDIILGGNACTITPDLLKSIVECTEMLKVANAQADIRSRYWDLGFPQVINIDDFARIWNEVIGFTGHKVIFDTASSAIRHGNGIYKDLEVGLLRELARREMIPALRKEQLQLLSTATKFEDKKGSNTTSNISNNVPAATTTLQQSTSQALSLSTDIGSDIDGRSHTVFVTANHKSSNATIKNGNSSVTHNVTTDITTQLTVDKYSVSSPSPAKQTSSNKSNNSQIGTSKSRPTSPLKHGTPTSGSRMASAKIDLADAVNSGSKLSPILLPSSSPSPPQQQNHRPNEKSYKNVSTIVDLTDRLKSYEDITLSVPLGAILKVLILCDNRISNLHDLHLKEFTGLTDIDLSYNHIAGSIDNTMFPPSIVNLDVSFNRIHDISGLVTCLEMKTLNVSHNYISRLTTLPSALTRFDISDNAIVASISLRVLSFSNKIVALGIAGNPVVDNTPDWRTRVTSCLPNLGEIDGVMRPGFRIKKTAQPFSPKYHYKHYTREEQVAADTKRNKAAIEKTNKLYECRDAKVKELQALQQRAKEKLNPSKMELLLMRLSTKEAHVGGRDLSTLPYKPAYHTSSLDASRNSVKHQNRSRSQLNSSASLSLSSPSRLSSDAVTNSDSKSTGNGNGSGNGNGIGKSMNVDESINVVTEWLVKCSDEVARAVTVFKLAVDMTQTYKIDSAARNYFQAAFGRVSFHNKVELSAKLELAINYLPYDSEHESLIKTVSDIIDNMTAIADLLKAVVKHINQSDSGADLLYLLDEEMSNERGKYVNGNILIPFGFPYVMSYHKNRYTEEVKEEAVDDDDDADGNDADGNDGGNDSYDIDDDNQYVTSTEAVSHAADAVSSMDISTESAIPSSGEVLRMEDLEGDDGEEEFIATPTNESSNADFEMHEKQVESQYVEELHISTSAAATVVSQSTEIEAVNEQPLPAAIAAVSVPTADASMSAKDRLALRVAQRMASLQQKQ